MDDKEGNKIFKNILFYGGISIGLIGGIYLLLPKLFTLLVSLLVGLLKISLIGSCIFSLAIGIAVINVKVKIKKSNKLSDDYSLEEDSDVMREKLYVVKNNEVVEEKTLSTEILEDEDSFVYKYVDAPDDNEIIDDLKDLDLTPIPGYSRKRYRGKYLK